MKFKLEAPPPLHFQGPTLQLRSVSFVYEHNNAKKTILSDVVLEVTRGARIGILGGRLSSDR